MLPGKSLSGILNLRTGGGVGRGGGGSSTINPDIFHLHLARKSGCAVRIAAEVTADRQIHDDVEWLVEWCRIRIADVRIGRIARTPPISLGFVKLIVHIPGDCIRRPLQRVKVKIYG